MLLYAFHLHGIKQTLTIYAGTHSEGESSV